VQTTVRLEERLPRRRIAVPRARQLASAALGRGGEASEDQDLALVVTELVANAIQHGRGRRIGIRVEADPTLVRVEVENRCWTTRPRRRLASEMRPSGRGLALVDAWSRSWGVHVDGRGRACVWAEVDRRPAPGDDPAP
jgi:anti-sigma regulatory factor (Ser/Thr protein kinase)